MVVGFTVNCALATPKHLQPPNGDFEGSVFPTKRTWHCRQSSEGRQLTLRAPAFTLRPYAQLWEACRSTAPLHSTPDSAGLTLRTQKTCHGLRALPALRCSPIIYMEAPTPLPNMFYRGSPSVGRLLLALTGSVPPSAPAPASDLSCLGGCSPPPRVASRGR